MNVLIATNHLSDFGGSEIIVLELYDILRSRGITVRIYANYIENPAAQCVELCDIIHDFGEVDLSEFDLVWCQHSTIIPLIANTDPDNLPQIVLVSLSPHEPYESIDYVVAQSLDLHTMLNSSETERLFSRRGKKLSRSIFWNASPKAFHSLRNASTRYILSISNHRPRELDIALDKIAVDNIHSVVKVGMADLCIRVTPGLIRNASCVVGNGKSISYGLDMGKPSYLYDHFGGAGWLNCGNFKRNQVHNFSGRPTRRALEWQDIYAEINDGLDSIASGQARPIKRSLPPFERYVDAFLGMASKRRLQKTRRLFKAAIQRQAFKDHLAYVGSLSEVARRNYRLYRESQLSLYRSNSL